MPSQPLLMVFFQHPALHRVPLNVFVAVFSPRGCFCWQCLWQRGEPDGQRVPPHRNGFLSLQPNQFFPIWLIAQPWAELCQHRAGGM